MYRRTDDESAYQRGGQVRRRQRLRTGRAEFANFVAVGVVGFAVNAVVMYAAVTGFGLPVMAAKCIAAGFTFTCNFCCRRQLPFVARRVA
jgi:putative flippase GtrA